MRKHPTAYLAKFTKLWHGLPVRAWVLLVLLTTGLIPAETFTVRQDGTADFTNIADAITSSTHGDEIIIYPGTYYERAEFHGKNIILRFS